MKTAAIIAIGTALLVWAGARSIAGASDMSFERYECRSRAAKLAAASQERQAVHRGHRRSHRTGTKPAAKYV